MHSPAPEQPTPYNSRSDTGNAPLQTRHSSELLGSQGAIQIDHKGAIYTLRATSKGGLILTK